MAGILIDVFVLLLLVFFTIVGYYKGFLRTILSLFGTVGSLVVAYLTKNVIANFLNDWFGWGTSIANVVMKQVSTLSQDFISVEGGTNEELVTIINNSKVGLIYKKIFSMIVPDEILQPTTVAGCVGNVVGNLALVVISFVLVFVLIKLIVFILNKILKKIPRRSVIGKANQILGSVIGLVNGLIAVVTIFVIVYFICLIPSVNEFIYPYIEKTLVTKYVYEFFGQILLKSNL